MSSSHILRSSLWTQDKFSAYPGIKRILEAAKSDRVAKRQRLDTYYDDEKLAALVKDAPLSRVNGTSSRGVTA